MMVTKDDDDDNANSNSKLLKFSTGEALTMLDRLINLKELSNEEKNSLVSIKDKL